MLVTGFVSVVITVIAKGLGDTFHPFQIMFFYCACGAVALLPAVAINFGCNKKAIPEGIRWRYHCMRAPLEFTGFALTFYSIISLPLPMATAISYMIPIFASIAAVLFVGEIITKRIAISLALGLVGICIMHNPFASDISSAQTLGIAAGIGAALAFSLCGSLIKLSTQSTPPILIAIIMLVLTTIVATPFAASVWVQPTPAHLGALALLGACVATVQYAVGRALKLGMITKLVPLMYLNLIWASLFAYFLFDEVISEGTIFGSLFIFGAVLFLTMSGRKKTSAPRPSEHQL